jgi:hypothetical protein
MWQIYKLTKAAPRATTPKAAAFRYPALEPAALEWTDDGVLEELAVGVGVTRRVELTVVLLELPVAIEGGDVTMPEGAVTKVVFENANAEETLDDDDE